MTDYILQGVPIDRSCPPWNVITDDLLCSKGQIVSLDLTADDEATLIAAGVLETPIPQSGGARLFGTLADDDVNPPDGKVLVYVDESGNLVARTQAGNVRTIAAV